MCLPTPPSMLDTTTFTLRTQGSGVDKYPAKAHAQRIADRLGAPGGLILLKGERSKLWSNSDMPQPFRQDRYFYYMSGCNEPNCFVSYDIAKDKLTLWLPPVNLERAYYDGRGSTVEEAMEKYDVDEAKYLHSKKKTERLAFMLKSEFIEKEKPWMFNKFPMGVIKRNLFAEKVDQQLNSKLRRAMNDCRAVKDEHEINLIRKANEISTAAHTAILKRLTKLKHETEVEAVFTGVSLMHGAKQQSYGPICGAGENASQLHYIANKCPFADACTLLVDAGAEWDCYASDVTRTIPLNHRNPGHWASKEQQVIYSAVAGIQETCIARLKPGAKFIHVNWHAQHMCIDALLDLGILKGEHMDIFHTGTFLAFFPHGLGHHMGLEVHDVQPQQCKKTDKAWTDRFRLAAAAYQDWTDQCAPQWTSTLTSLLQPKTQPQSKRFGLNPLLFSEPCTPHSPPLEPGNVVTIEPGIYFNRFILEEFFLKKEEHAKFIDEAVLKRYMHVGGVRIEDDILITRDGYENLTTAPKGKEMLEVIRESVG